MFIWLPERIYNQVKDQVHFQEVDQAINDYYTKNVLSLPHEQAYKATQNIDQHPLVINYIETVKQYLNSNMKREIDIISQKDEENIQNMLEQEGDVENLLMGTYRLCDAFYSDFNKGMMYQNKFLKILQQKDTGKLSFRIYLKAMQYECRLFTYGTDFKKYPSFAIEGVQEIIEQYVAKYGSNEDEIRVKAMEEYDLLLRELYKQGAITVTHIRRVLQNINVPNYEYKDCHVFKLKLYHTIFMYLFEMREFTLCKNILDEIRNIIKMPLATLNKAANSGNLNMIKNLSEEKSWFETINYFVYGDTPLELPHTDAKEFYNKGRETFDIFKEVNKLGK